jgi:regulator of CtrA degradation
VPLLHKRKSLCETGRVAIAKVRVAGLTTLAMSPTVSINPRILDSLYGEALVLSDEVRATFALSGRIGQYGEDEDLARIALSCEALRTTTRMMHAVAWLLNHRAYLEGELSEFQLRRNGRLSPNVSRSDAEHCAMLEPSVRALIAATERFYARLLRLDRSWRSAEPATPPLGAIARLRERLAQGAPI